AEQRLLAIRPETASGLRARQNRSARRLGGLGRICAAERNVVPFSKPGNRRNEPICEWGVEWSVPSRGGRVGGLLQPAAAQPKGDGPLQRPLDDQPQGGLEHHKGRTI